MSVKSTVANRRSTRSFVRTSESTDPVNYPWRVPIDDAVFAVDLIRSVAIHNLLERLDRAPANAMQNVRRTLLAITWFSS